MLFVTISLIGLYSCRTVNLSRKGSGCKAQKVRQVGHSAGADEGVVSLWGSMLCLMLSVAPHFS